MIQGMEEERCRGGVSEWLGSDLQSRYMPVQIRSPLLLQLNRPETGRIASW